MNCPNCGAGIAGDSTKCEFCRTRLKTRACNHCLGLLFIGSKHCSHCGKETVETTDGTETSVGRCPRCSVPLEPLIIGDTSLRECHNCSGLWMTIASFEELCSDRDEQSAVLDFQRGRDRIPVDTLKISYVPCPVCTDLMNRSNFARASGVIIDTCRTHGVWFDADELPRIVSFIRDGGMRTARQRELRDIEDQRSKLRMDTSAARLRVRRIASEARFDDDGPKIAGFLRKLFE